MLFLGFIQLHVPIMAIVDMYFSQNDSEYETTKTDKRKKMIIFSVLISLFAGVTPLFGWPKMDFEPTGLSCSAYENKPGNGYLTYMIFCMMFFEIVPFMISVFCLINSNGKPKATYKVKQKLFGLLAFMACKKSKYFFV